MADNEGLLPNTPATAESPVDKKPFRLKTFWLQRYYSQNQAPKKNLNGDQTSDGSGDSDIKKHIDTDMVGDEHRNAFIKKFMKSMVTSGILDETTPSPAAASSNIINSQTDDTTKRRAAKKTVDVPIASRQPSTRKAAVAARAITKKPQLRKSVRKSARLTAAAKKKK